VKVVDLEAMSDNATKRTLLSKVTAVKRDCWGDVMSDDSNVDCVISLSVESKNADGLSRNRLLRLSPGFIFCGWVSKKFGIR